MFGLDMLGNYDSRKVDRFENGDLKVSTACVTDGRQPFETAVAHPDYNGGKLMIVEGYDDRDSALAGHARWVVTMTSESLPDEIKDCCNAGIAQVLSEITPESLTYKRTKKGQL